MWPFKKKCGYEIHDIVGMFYFREDYLNESILHGIVVFQQGKSRKIYFDDCYVESFSGLTREQQMQCAISSLKKAGFLPKVDFRMQHLNLKIPF